MNEDIHNLARKLIPYLSKILTYRKLPFIEHNLKLEKDNILPSHFKVLPNVLDKTINIIDFSKISKNAIKEEKLHEFLNVLKEKMSHANFYILCHNLESLRFWAISNPLLKDLFLNSYNRIAYYNFSTNFVCYDKDKKDDTFMHEMFHASSWLYHRYKHRTKIGGFYQLCGRDYIGRGLDEGYTSHLSEKYFKETRAYEYDASTNAAIIIESIVGSEKMEKYYFKADLYGLVGDLKQHISEKEIIDLLREVDYFHYLSNVKEYDENEIIINKKESLANEIYATLCYWVSLKCLSDYSDHRITKEDVYKTIEKLSFNNIYHTNIPSTFRYIYDHKVDNPKRVEVIDEIARLMNYDYINNKLIELDENINQL